MKQYLKVCFKIIMAFLPVIALSQDLPEVLPPSPTVANLMQFEEVPVSYYTGQPNISIPFYSKAISGDLAVNVSLSYNTQSVKVNNRSGWTGTGWSLNAGGVISRTVRGLPDEMVRNSSTITGEGVLHNDDFWNYDSLSAYDKQEFLWRSGGTTADKYDYESDLFQFNALGVSGRFVIVKEVNNTLVPKLLSKNQNIKIDIDYHPTTFTLNKFTITDTKGYKYTFDVTEDLYSQPFTAIEYFNGNQTSSGTNADYTSTNSWHLSKIEMPNSNNGSLTLATFTYQTIGEVYNASVTREESRPINPGTDWNTYMSLANTANAYNNSVMQPRITHSYYVVSAGTKKLSRITFNKDGSYVDFEVDNSFVHPETNGKALEYIRIKDASHTENKHFKFVYDSNISNRLWLNEIQEVAGGLSNDYVLEYNDKFSLPQWDSPNETDDWGYYKDNSTTSCGLPISNGTTIQKGLLTKIIYPTGGSKEFEFERQQITYQGATQLSDNEYKDKNPDNWIPQDLSLSFNSATDNSAQSSNVTTYSFYVSQTQEIVYKKLSTTATPTEQFNAFIEVTGPNNYREVFRLDEDELYFTVATGTYTVKFFTLTLGTNYNYTGCIGYKNFTSTIKRFVYGGGVRIKSVVFKDDPLDTQNQREITYDYSEDGTQNKSSGSIDGLLTGLVKTHTKTVSRYLLPEACPLNASMNAISFLFEIKTQGLNVELTQGQYVGYKTVNMSEQNKGYSKFTYTSAQDYHSPLSTFTYPYTPADDLDYKRGLLLKSEVFDNNDKQLKEDINTYSFVEDIVSPTYRLYNTNDCEWKMFYNFYSEWAASSPINELNMCYGGNNGGQSICDSDCLGVYSTCGDYYFFLSNDVKATWARLDETINKEYFFDANGNNQTTKETRQVFTYSDDNYQVKTQDTYYKVKGVDEHLETKYYYPVGITLGSNSIAIKNKLIASNKVTEVLETQSYRNGVMISETHNIYDDFDSSSNDLMLPKEVKVGKSTLTPEPRIEFLKYDS
ncbi:MAG: hypothetical protein EVB11_12040, partial [Winogradskyella sp.]